jgi:hypothetical protein
MNARRHVDKVFLLAAAAAALRPSTRVTEGIGNALATFIGLCGSSKHAMSAAVARRRDDGSVSGVIDDTCSRRLAT